MDYADSSFGDASHNKSVQYQRNSAHTTNISLQDASAFDFATDCRFMTANFLSDDSTGSYARIQHCLNLTTLYAS